MVLEIGFAKGCEYEDHNGMWQFKIYERDNGNNRRNGFTGKLHVKPDISNQA